MTAADAAAVLLLAAATGLAGLRWLRVAQREHYLTGSVSRFAARWWILGPNLILGAALAVAALASGWAPLAPFAAAAAVAAGPFGLGLRGRTSNLVFTDRLKRLAGVWLAMQLAIVAAGLALGEGPLFAAIGAAAVPVILDAALAVAAPLERRLSQPFVDSARRKLDSIRPTVVAITGSYGKTSTKQHIAHLVAGSRSVVASPKSYNNRNGLARTVNDHLPPGTEVLVAEMGIYGPGEIRDMCEWVPPDIAVITAIGPVHLERMGSEENILAAKAEITERAATVVLNADDQRLAHLALSPQLAGKKVVLASARDAHAAAAATPGESGLDVAVSGRPLLTGLDTDAPPTNIAVAVAVALELGVPPEVIAERLPSLPQAENRLDRTQGAGGFTILDDTFNSNPAGARRALDALASVRQEGRRAVVVTPGMVELGPRQQGENAAFAEAAGAVATDLVVVGHTNRRALLAGAARAGLEPVLVADRQAAVAWVKANLGPGDAVLYENDLPDHWP